MRLVTRKELMDLPAGTIYQEYEPKIFRTGLCIKGETTVPWSEKNSGDWTLLDLPDFEDFMSDTTKLEVGHSVKFDFKAYGRDGCYAEDQMYAVWEPDELAHLAILCENAIKASVEVTND